MMLGNLSVSRRPTNLDNSRARAFVVLLFYVHGKHLRSCRDGQLT